MTAPQAISSMASRTGYFPRRGPPAGGSAVGGNFGGRPRFGAAGASGDGGVNRASTGTPRAEAMAGRVTAKGAELPASHWLTWLWRTFADSANAFWERPAASRNSLRRLPKDSLSTSASDAVN